MPYITVNRTQKPYQITLEDILNGIDEEKLIPRADTKDTITREVAEFPWTLTNRIDFEDMYNAIKDFNKKYENLIAVEDKSTLYRSFKIPKRSGGMRQIDAPKQELMLALRELKAILEHKFYFTHHTAAFAYVQGRSAKTAVQRHQKNKSRWFLKLDFSQFFPSTTEKFLESMLYQTFPLCVFVNHDFGYREEFEKALSLCFLRGGLPQGTPTSPMLTNQMMIPIDHQIAKMCHDNSPHLCYTRYADDMHISSEYDFGWADVVYKITQITESFDAPFRLNREKTHYGNSNGRNWMLGLMLNKDGNITIGHAKKHTAKAMVNQFLHDAINGKQWSLEDTQCFAGVLAYYRNIEPDFVSGLIRKYNEKYNDDVMNRVKSILRSA